MRNGRKRVTISSISDMISLLIVDVVDHVLSTAAFIAGRDVRKSSPTGGGVGLCQLP